MDSMKMKKTVLVLCFLLALVGARPAAGCSIPVFEYALQFWMPADYEVFVFHEDPLSQQQQALVSELQELADYRKAERLNARVTRADVTGELAEEVQKLWEQQSPTATPWLVVCLPGMGMELFPVWSGELVRENVKMLAGSPLRSRLAEQILSGTSIVWVLMESGQQQNDDRAAELIQEALPRLEKELVLPIAYDYGYYGEEQDAESAPPEEHPELSFIRLQADSEQEEMIHSILSATLPQERWNPSEAPLAFPVFGRGRVLDVLAGEEINARNVEDLCRFLTGACQCTIKAQNPGLDLMMAANWEDWQMESTPEAAPATQLENVELTGLFTESEEREEAVEDAGAPEEVPPAADPLAEEDPVAGQETAAPANAGGNWLTRSIILSVLAVAACAVAGTLILRRKHGSA